MTKISRTESYERGEGREAFREEKRQRETERQREKAEEKERMWVIDDGKGRGRAGRAESTKHEAQKW